MVSRITEFLMSSNRQAGAAERERREARVAHWLAALDRLYTQVEHWLQESIDSHAAVVRRIPASIFEEAYGHYEAGRLLVSTGNATISFEPRGAFVLGAAGRVDVNGPDGNRVVVVLIDNEWQWVAVDSRTHGSTPKLLDEDGFLTVLRYLLAGEDQA